MAEKKEKKQASSEKKAEKPKMKTASSAAKPKAKTTAKKATAVKTKTAPKATSKSAPKKKPAAKTKTTAKKSPVKKVTEKKAVEKKPVAKKSPRKKAPAKKVVKAKAAEPKSTKYSPRLEKQYGDSVIPTLIEKFGYKNRNMVPKINKICLNSGVGKAKEDMKDLEKTAEDLMLISGQKAVVTKAKTSISNFKLRIGDPVGCRVTIRGSRMYEFLDRLITIAIPRVRDFTGLRVKSFDGQGNYSLGVKEQIIFPEIDYDRVDKIRGFDITIVTSASNDEEGYELLKAFGMPFRQPVQGGE